MRTKATWIAAASLRRAGRLQGRAPPPGRDESWNGTFNRLWAKRGRLFFGFVFFYGASNFLANKYRQRQRDAITLGSSLHWRLANTSVVESHTTRGQLKKVMEAFQEEDADVVKVYTLLELTEAIRTAALDDRILCLSVDMSSAPGVKEGSPLGLAQAHELREAIKAFREAKAAAFGPEHSYCMAYADTFDSQALYYLASAFDRVFLQPSGNVPLTGLGSSMMFYKRALDRVGVEMQAEAREGYKSMVSPFIRRELTPEQKDNLLVLLGGLNTQILREMGEGRGLAMRKAEMKKEEEGKEPTPVEAKEKSDTEVEEEVPIVVDTVAAIAQIQGWSMIGPFSARDAQGMGLVDRLLYPRAVKESVKDKYKPVSMSKYIRVRREELKSKGRIEGERPPVIALVHISGGIKRGSAEFGAAAVRKALVEAATDPEVKAIVLRVDSPGGDVIASDTIAEAIKYCQVEKEKPVIASFGNYAASGGYYISTHCHRIFASPLTVTGSIGVAALRPHLTEKLLDHVGLDVGSHYLGSKVTNSFERLEGEALARFRRDVDGTYEDFLTRVSEGRSMSMEKTRALAGGRVWTGTQAQEIGLVDNLGGLRDALLYAALDLSVLEAPQGTRAMFPNTRIINPMEVRIFPRKRTLFERLRQDGAGEEVRGCLSWLTYEAMAWARSGEAAVALQSEIASSTQEAVTMEMDPLLIQ